MTKKATFADDLRATINRHSRENASNTPDFILATFLDSCLAAFGVAMDDRDRWYGSSAPPLDEGERIVAGSGEGNAAGHRTGLGSEQNARVHDAETPVNTASTPESLVLAQGATVPPPALRAPVEQGGGEAEATEAGRLARILDSLAIWTYRLAKSDLTAAARLLRELSSREPSQAVEGVEGTVEQDSRPTLGARALGWRIVAVPLAAFPIGQRVRVTALNTKRRDQEGGGQ